MSESSGWAVLELETGSQRFEMEKYEKYEGIGGSRDHDETFLQVESGFRIWEETSGGDEIGR